MMILIHKKSGVSIMHLRPGADAAECIEKWKAVNVGEYVSHEEVTADKLPPNRSSRAKWKFVAGAVVVPK